MNDVGICGGGLAGLSLAILLKRRGLNVTLFEKGSYPQHKVCGEYLSHEIIPYIQELGLSDALIDSLPVITKLLVSSPNGKTLRADLPLSAVGISRYLLDATLADIAVNEGVELKTNTRVTGIEQTNKGSQVHFNGLTEAFKQVIDAHGKIGTIRAGEPSHNEEQNYIGVKYHIKYEGAKDLISLHNYEDGYCGMSAVENDTFCLCYLVNAELLKKHHNSLEELEEQVILKNPYLKEVFKNAEFLWQKPQVISNISLSKRPKEVEGLPSIGDAAGVIAPLAGNGMTMAIKSAFIFNDCLDIEGDWIRLNTEKYAKLWSKNFGLRVRAGRMLQPLLKNPKLTDLAIGILGKSQFLTRRLISLTHG